MATEAIIDHVWGPRGADRDMVRQLVHRLRLKIEPDPNNPEYIETVAGLGYGFMKTTRNRLRMLLRYYRGVVSSSALMTPRFVFVT